MAHAISAQSATRVPVVVQASPASARHAAQGRGTPRAVRLVARADADEGIKGVVPGAAQWPPKPITEHGQPKPEDDPQNYEGASPNQTRVGGPSEEELEEKRQKGREESPFSNPKREGGTQLGGGGEGSAS